MARAEFIIDTTMSPDQIYQVLYNPKLRLQWDSSSLKTFDIYDETKDSMKVYMVNKAPWPLKNRDFIEQHFIHRKGSDRIQVFSQSIQDD
jgi:hypothetical protein